MHSSEMRTARLLTVSRGGVFQGGVYTGGVCPGGCQPRGSAQGGGICIGGCLTRGGWGGVSAQGVVCHTPHPQTRGRQPPRGQRDTCENITFANFVCRRKKYLQHYSKSQRCHGLPTSTGTIPENLREWGNGL